MKPCGCLPAIDDPKFVAHIATGGICIYANGQTIQHAIDRVRQHAKHDKIPESRWIDIWVEDMNGCLVDKGDAIWGKA